MAGELGMIGNMLGAAGAGLSGQMPQYMAGQRQQQELDQRQQMLQQQQGAKAEEERRKRELERQKTVFSDSESALKLAQSGRWDLVSQLGQSRMQMGQQHPGADFKDTKRLTEMAGMAAQGDTKAQEMLLKQLQDNVEIGRGLGVLERPEEADTDIGTEGRAFKDLLAGLPEGAQKEAIKIKLGLKGRRMGSAAQTIAQEGTADLVAESEATIRERTKFAEMSGASRSKAIDKGYERIQKIDKGVRNIDRAIDAVRKGAGSGALEKKFPSIRQASVELDQIADSMALDVIGAVTLGAISATELDLAKQVALPRGLNPDALIEHLQARSAAQGKLRAYFGEQIDFLDQGGTVAGFLRGRKASQAATPQAAPAAQGAQPAGAVNWSDM
tara:strand:+ start:2257 stop:3414 length:1158 start_codon:yes stop_codon:yes gene_type:complete